MYMKLFAYGMLERGYGPGCQPSGAVDWKDFDTRTTMASGNRVWSIIWYDRLLSPMELFEYQLVRLPNEDKNRISLTH